MEQEELLKRIQELEEKMANIENPHHRIIGRMRQFFMNVNHKKGLLLLVILLPLGLLLAASINKPHTFSSGQTIKAADINANFTSLKTAIEGIETIPAGTIVAYGGTTTPTGWLLCNGGAVSRTTYSVLFNAIGTSFGNGDGSTTFNVPDLRGRFLRGLDGTANVDPDKTSRTTLNGGNTGNALGSVQDDAFQGHWHAMEKKMYVYNNTSVYLYGFALSNNYYASDHYPSVTSPITDGTNGTPRTTSETRPKNVYVNFVVKY